eukprot:PhM_4_TR437/c0_g1_i8/m.102
MIKDAVRTCPELAIVASNGSCAADSLLSPTHNVTALHRAVRGGRETMTDGFWASVPQKEVDVVVVRTQGPLLRSPWNRFPPVGGLQVRRKNTDHDVWSLSTTDERSHLQPGRDKMVDDAFVTPTKNPLRLCASAREDLLGERQVGVCVPGGVEAPPLVLHRLVRAAPV